MTFGNGYFLLLALTLLPLALAGIMALRWKKRSLARFGDPSLMAFLAASASRSRQTAKLILVLVALLLLVVAIAQPQWGSREIRLPQAGVDIIFALDVSQSMAAQDAPPNRLEWAKKEIIRFLDGLAGERVGLVIFAGSAFPRFPLTNDLEAAKALMKDAATGMTLSPGTDLQIALATAHQGFSKERLGAKVVVVVSDGEDQGSDASAEAARLAREGVVVYALGVGTASGAPIPQIGEEEGRAMALKRDAAGQLIISRLNPRLLQDIAQRGGGKYIDGDGAFLRQELAAMRRPAGKEEVRSVPEERFQLFALAALALLTGEFLLSEGRRRQ